MDPLLTNRLEGSQTTTNQHLSKRRFGVSDFEGVVEYFRQEQNEIAPRDHVFDHM